MISGFFVPHNKHNNSTNAISFNINSLNYISVLYGLNKIKLLIDTGASISCIFTESLNDCEIVDTTRKINVKGIVSSTLTKGTAAYCRS